VKLVQTVYLRSLII